MRVEIWSDVVCPWCYIGKRQFEEALARLHDAGTGTDIEVVYRSYQLDPTAPPGGSTPAREAYARKFGGYERADQIIGHVTRIAADSGIEFRMDRAIRANTMLAHRALHFVLTEIGSTAQAAMKEQLLRAYFTDGENVGDLDVVVSCAERAGIDADALRRWLESDVGVAEVVADIEAAQMRDITGVPAFVLDDRFLIPGAQDVDVFEQLLTRALNTQ
ncbi:MAG: DsbA family oxidoreductase [Actinobacteria bacterium]|nr:DsbA family oxidoreductase [Actinomycetota bacterium]